MMFALTTILIAGSALTVANPVPQGTPTTPCNDSIPTRPFQLAAVPTFANYSLLALESTGGGSGLVIIPQPDASFEGVANFTYNKDTLRFQTQGNPVGDTVYTSLDLENSLSLSLSADPQDGPSNIAAIGNVDCDGLPFFVKSDEQDVGLYGWTLCNNGALGWVGATPNELCERVALKAYVNETAEAT